MSDDPLPKPHALLRSRFAKAQRFPQPAMGAIDEVNGIGGRVPDPATIPHAIPRGAPVYIHGWVWQPAIATAPLAAIVTVDGAYVAPARSGLLRPDVAAVHGAAAEASGFEAHVPSHDLSDGLHVVTVVLMHDFITYSEGPQHIVTIVPGALRTTVTTPLAGGQQIELDSLEIIGPMGSYASDVPSDGIVRYGSTVRARGWAIDVVAAQPCAGIYAIIDDEHVVRGRYGGPRSDVAAELGDPQFYHCAFEIHIDTAVIGIGDHVLRIGALSADGTTRSEEQSRSLQIRF